MCVRSARLTRLWAVARGQSHGRVASVNGTVLRRFLGRVPAHELQYSAAEGVRGGTRAFVCVYVPTLSIVKRVCADASTSLIFAAAVRFLTTSISPRTPCLVSRRMSQSSQRCQSSLVRGARRKCLVCGGANQSRAPARTGGKWQVVSAAIIQTANLYRSARFEVRRAR